MKVLIIFVGLLTAVSPSFAQSARDYFDELYKAGGLDRVADGYVCFADDSTNQNFFIFSESKYLKDFLIDKGQFKTLSKANQTELNRGYLISRGYTKGIPHAEQLIYDKAGDSWITEKYLLDKTPARTRLTIAWSTLRYKRSVEVLNSNSTSLSEQASGFGRCEVIPPGVEQKGN